LLRLQALAPRLNEASDRLGRTIALVEKALAELNLGVTAYVGFSDCPSHDEIDYFDGICYEKVNGNWAICRTRGIAGDPDSCQTTRLASASRDIRLKVAEDDLIPKLIDALLAEAEKKVAQVEKAARACERIASKLGVNSEGEHVEH
jgi:hypothetical protein